MSVVSTQRPHLWPDRDETSPGHPVGRQTDIGWSDVRNSPGVEVKISIGSCNGGMNVFYVYKTKTYVCFT